MASGARGVAPAQMTASYRHLVLVILTVMYVINYLDRQILNILLQPIKNEFHVSDTALGLLAGPTFAAFYATLGIPIARLADRFNRRNIIAWSMGLFSLMTVFCGMAAQFGQLLVARILTGVGEAGTGPSAMSIISDLYPPKSRSTAQSFYGAGLNIGILLAFLFGGLIAQKYGWRMAFLAAGIPGLIMMFVVFFAMKEPVRGHSEQIVDDGATVPLGQVCRFLWSQRSIRFIALGCSMSAFGGYGATAFVPAFLMRTHHMTVAHVGLIFALIAGVGGWAGTFLSGVVADRLAKHDVRWNMFVPMSAGIIGLPFSIAFYLAPSTTVAVLAAVVPSSLGAVFLGPCIAMTQGLVSLRMRVTAAAILLFILNIIGLGLGPQAVGFMSDLLAPSLGVDSLRYALLIGPLSGLIASYLYWQASKTLKTDLQRGAGA